jgi:hypothetical protein
MTLPPELLVRSGEHAAFVAEGPDVIAANLLTSAVHLISGTGASIWRLIDGASSVAGIIDALAAAYPDGDRDLIGEQVVAYLEKLRDAGLVELIAERVRA